MLCSTKYEVAMEIEVKGHVSEVKCIFKTQRFVKTSSLMAEQVLFPKVRIVVPQTRGAKVQ